MADREPAGRLECSDVNGRLTTYKYFLSIKMAILCFELQERQVRDGKHLCIDLQVYEQSLLVLVTTGRAIETLKLA